MTTLIIGGGLSGLALAEGLEKRGHAYLLVEARAQFGGRIETVQHGAGNFDLGPAWFWPGQPRISAMINRLGLTKFDQFAEGILSYENERGQVHRGQGFSSMQGSWRLEGGLAALTQALAARLPDARKRLNSVVTRLEKTGGGITATLSDGDTMYADRVVLALPPRVAARISYVPALPDTAVNAMRGISTWMAGQAKAVAVYDTPFWRKEGLSGDATSRLGPMVEIHDASPAADGPYALFGFIGLPPHARSDEQLLRRQLLAQLERIFGSKAAEPEQLYVKDWAIDPHTATEADKAPLFAHPAYGLPKAMTNLWGNSLHFAGTEVAPQFGGYLEGALEAAENILNTINANEQESANVR